MKEIKTKDGSITFHNEEYDETYHSISGGEEEATKKFILPSLKYFKPKLEVNILDVCFGLGYNSAAAIDEIRKIDPDLRINIIALENDKRILEKIESIDSRFTSFSMIKEAAKNLDYKDDNTEIKIILGDAIEEIKKLDEKKIRFDLIFHDPFSTKKMPNFWTLEFFSQERRLIKDNGLLTTYSCARLVRENLKGAGFKTKDVEPVGRRAPSTIAYI